MPCAGRSASTEPLTGLPGVAMDLTTRPWLLPARRPPPKCACHVQRTGRARPGKRQRSTRDGTLPARTKKRVYFPILPLWRTNSSSVVPTGSVPSNRRKRTMLVALVRVSEVAGQPRPRQRRRNRAPRGARTDRTRTETPRRKTTPAMRTIGKGDIITSRVPGAGRDGIAGEFAAPPRSAWRGGTQRPDGQRFERRRRAPCSSVAVSTTV